MHVACPHFQNLRLLAVTLALPLVAGCAEPARTLRLDPLDPGVRWLDGQAWLRSEKDGIRVRLGYRATPPGPIIFDLEIQNAGAADVILRPQESYLLADSHKAEPVGALDPEATLLALDVQRSRVEASDRQSAGLDAVMALSDFVATLVGTEDSPTEAEAAKKRLSTVEEETNRLEREQVYERMLQDIAARRHEIATTSMRCTTLAPGETARGALRFPARVGDAPFTVFVTAGPQKFQFRFQPRWKSPAMPATRQGWPRAAEAGRS